MLEHQLTAAQIQIYDAYAEAFQIIHQNLQEALKENNVVDFEGKSRNKNTKAAAMSAFEGNKQRFFNHLLISMKCPTLLKAIAQDLENGHAVVVQIVSTDEALLDRRLAEIPPSEWSDLQIDVTPREYIMDYLMNSFPIHLHEVYTDEKGVEHSYSVTDSKGNPVICQESLRKRDELIENLGLLPPVQGSLDQIVQHFGYENVAEVTGRSKRIVRETKGGRDRLTVQKRPGSSNICETQAFMDDKKRILVFSEAGGTGRSYHSDRNVKNQRLRVHYLLEAGWKADSAIQGLGRTNRTNQVQAPLFRPVATNVKGEKRFLSTIARRLDSLGALTRGQRQTGGQGLFREEDNLESPYAKAALRQLFTAIYANKVPCCSLKQFQESTGLSLTDKEGYLKEELPPISQFLNRVLALPIQQQNDLFAEFETRLENKIEEAIAAGTYEVGVETLRAESLTILSTQRIYTHPQTQAQTQCVKIQRKQKTKILSLEDALSIYRSRGKLVLNERSGKVAVMVPTNSLQGENGEIISRVNLLRPASSEKVFLDSITESYWQETDQWTFTRIWQEEVDKIPEYVVDLFYLITGLLLPIWDRLDAENMRVFRLQTDNGERLLGRLVEAENLAVVYENLGISETPVLSKEEILQAVFKRREVVPLIRSWQLAAKTVAGNQRLEILGVQNSEVSRLKALGCITEVISWQTRIFIPTNNALHIIDQILGDR
jgi:hypothetical protein